MEFVKEFVTFLHQKEVIKFGNFTLASGKNSSYYVDLRLVPKIISSFLLTRKFKEGKVFLTFACTAVSVGVLENSGKK